MGLLTIDIGNTAVKYAVFQEDRVIESGKFFPESIKEITSVFLKNQHIKESIICSVANEKVLKQVLEQVKVYSNYSVINHQTPFPFKSNYTSGSLGLDRAILISAAVLEYPKTNVLVIDAGTCITYDLVNQSAIHLGGAISPGVRMRYQAMSTWTANLPELGIKTSEVIRFETSTEGCIHSGVINGICSEVDGFIDFSRKNNENLTIILTGGNADFLANQLKNRIFARPYFLMIGLKNLRKYLSKL